MSLKAGRVGVNPLEADPVDGSLLSTKKHVGACTDVVGTVQKNILKKINNIVFFILELNSVTVASDGVICKLPSGFYPDNDFTTVCAIGGQAKSIRITHTGNVTSPGIAITSASIRLSVTWFTV